MRSRTKLLTLAAASACALVALWLALRAEAPASSTAREHSEDAVATTPRAPAALEQAEVEVLAPTAPATRVEQGVEIRGRLVDASTGLPLPGRTIVLRARHRPLASTVTRLAPRFESSVVQLLSQNFVSGAGSRNGRFLGLIQGQTSSESPVESSSPSAEPTTEAASDEAPNTEAAAPEPPSQEAEPSSPPRFVHRLGENFDLQIALGQHVLAANRLVIDLGDGTTLDSERGMQPALVDLQRSLAQQVAAQVLEARQLQPVVDPSFAWAAPADLGAQLGWTFPPFPRRTLATTTTDEDGRFRFECPEEQDVELVLQPLDGDWIEDELWTFRGTAPCAEEIDWRVHIAPGRRVEGRVIDARTGAPLEALTVELRGTRGWIETVETDLEGRFASSTIFPAGHVEWTIHDGSEERRIAAAPREIELTPASVSTDELLIVATMGPTYRFRFTREEFEYAQSKRIQVLQEHDGSGMELRLVGAEPLPGWEGSGNPFADWEPIRPSEEERPAFVRYPVAPRVPRGAYFEFRSSDGSWCGSASPAEGVQPIEVVLHPSARVVVRARLTEDASEGAWSVRATRAAGSGAAGAYESVPCFTDGTAVFEHVDPNLVRAVELLRDGVVVRTVRLAFEAESTLEIEL